MTVITSTGLTVAVSANEPATIDETGFAALSYTTIGEVTDFPEYGPNTDVVNHQPLATGITEKYKGFTDYGSTSMGLGRDATDAGQAILSAGSTPGGGTFNTNHSFKLTYSDGSVDYFYGQIFSYTKAPGSANSIVASTANIEINSKIVEVAAP